MLVCFCRQKNNHLICSRSFIHSIERINIHSNQFCCHSTHFLFKLFFYFLLRNVLHAFFFIIISFLRLLLYRYYNMAEFDYTVLKSRISSQIGWNHSQMDYLEVWFLALSLSPYWFDIDVCINEHSNNILFIVDHYYHNHHHLHGFFSNSFVAHFILVGIGSNFSFFFFSRLFFYLVRALSFV